AEDIAWFGFRQRRVYTGRACANDYRFWRSELLYARQVPGAGIDQACVGIKGDRNRVRPARRPDFDFFPRSKALVQIGQYRTAGSKVDLCGPIHLDEGMRGYQFAVSAVQHIHEAVLVCLNHYLPKLAANLNVREHLLVGGVHIVNVVRRVLKITSDLTCFWPNSEYAIRE